MEKESGKEQKRHQHGKKKRKIYKMEEKENDVGK
jgi:hypothetical protein